MFHELPAIYILQSIRLRSGEVLQFVWGTQLDSGGACVSRAPEMKNAERRTPNAERPTDTTPERGVRPVVDCNPLCSVYHLQSWRGHSSVGRAPALQAGSQGFESPCLQSTLAAQRRLSRRSLGEGGQRFTSLRTRSELRLGKPNN
jgi:hypothetical protein